MIFLGFTYIHCESVNFVNIFKDINIGWLVSLMWLSYAGIISTVGILKNKKYLKNSGIFICIFSVVRVFMFDMAGLDMLFKLIAMITLGFILMYVSYIYNKHN